MAPLPAGRALAPAAGAGAARARGRRARSRSASTRRSSSCSRRAPRPLHPALSQLGPDLLAPDFDAPRRIDGCATRPAPADRDRRRAARSAGAGRHRQRLQERDPVRSSGFDPFAPVGRRRRRDARPADRDRPAAARDERDARRGPERVTTGGDRCGRARSSLRSRGGRATAAGRRSRATRQGTDLPRTTYWCPTCQGARPMTEHRGRRARPPRTAGAAASTVRDAGSASTHDVTVSRRGRDRPGRRSTDPSRRQRLVEATFDVPARARAEGVDPARRSTWPSSSRYFPDSEPRSGAGSRPGVPAVPRIIAADVRALRRPGRRAVPARRAVAVHRAARAVRDGRASAGARPG